MLPESMARAVSSPKNSQVQTPAPKLCPRSWQDVWGWHVIVLLGVIVLFGAIRWRLADAPLERDEGEYAYAGQLILEGIPPYQLAYNMKLPGTYAAYAGILAIFGQTSGGIHLGLLFVNAVSGMMLYVIAAWMFGRLAGAISGASFILLSTHQAVLGFAAHATHFVVVSALVGLILLLRAEQSKGTFCLFLSGLAFGVAFLMKQPGILFGVFGIFYLGLSRRPKCKAEWAFWMKKMAVFLLGGVLPFAMTCGLLYRAGVFNHFWFWTFSYAREYATTMSWRGGMTFLTRNFSEVFLAAPEIWIIAAVGILALISDRTARPHGMFVFGLLAFSLAAVCPGLYFRPHYFILLLPVVALLTGVAVACIVHLLQARFNSRWALLVPCIAFAGAWTLALAANREVYFEFDPLEAFRYSYFPSPFQEALPVAEYLKEHTAPTETVLVFGSEPEIYFYAHRHSATGYIYTYSLTEDQPYWPVMQRQMMQEVEANRPAYVVFVNVKFSWIYAANSPQVAALSAWFDQYMARDFQEVGMVECHDAASQFYWGDEAFGHRRPTREILIFKRKG